MGISARNVFKGKVTQLKTGPVNAELEIETVGGDRIVAIVTEASVRSLGLSVGVEAVAVIKAPWVTLLSGTPEYRFSARNQLKGTVSGIVKGAVNSQVNVTLPGGATLSSIVTNEAIAEMNISQGAPIVALFKAGHVLVGVPA